MINKKNFHKERKRENRTQEKQVMNMVAPLLLTNAQPISEPKSQYSFGQFRSPVLALLTSHFSVQLLSSRAWHFIKSLTQGKHYIASAKTSGCYQCHSYTASKTHSFVPATKKKMSQLKPRLASTTSPGNLFQHVHQPHSKGFLPNNQSKSALFQFKVILPCLALIKVLFHFL